MKAEFQKIFNLFEEMEKAGQAVTLTFTSRGGKSTVKLQLESSTSTPSTASISGQFPSISIMKIINTNPRMFTPCKGACWARGPVVEFTPVSPSPLLHCLQKMATAVSMSKLNIKHTPSRSSPWSKMRPKTAQF